jgi:hypothetical protein
VAKKTTKTAVTITEEDFDQACRIIDRSLYTHLYAVVNISEYLEYLKKELGL